MYYTLARMMDVARVPTSLRRMRIYRTAGPMSIEPLRTMVHPLN